MILIPFFPVWAFAFPELTINAFTKPLHFIPNNWRRGVDVFE